METIRDEAERLDGPALIERLRGLGVAEYHIKCVTDSNNVTLARALFVYFA